MSQSSTTSLASPWPHRLAVAMVCATFPLIWVGAMVTTHEAGMAVPDWPNTYGYNLFLYPWQTWLLGPFDLLIEHGHRLLGAAVGMLAIGALLLALRNDRRLWLRYYAAAVLAVVCLQGALGGSRVLLDSRDLARIHGCVGPLFFAMTVALAAFTSGYWTSGAAAAADPSHGKLHRLSVLTVALTYAQIVVGANVRHLSLTTTPGQFEVIVWFHLLLALALAVHVVLLWRAARDAGPQPLLIRPALALIGLMACQLALGIATWITNYGWPVWFHNLYTAEAYVVQQESYSQALVTTAHVATGSLILAASVLVMLRSFRLVRVGTPRIEVPLLVAGMAV